MKKNKTLNFEDRRIIEDLLLKSNSQKYIIETLKIHPSTLYREMKRCKEFYNAEEAQKSVSRSRCSIDFKIIGKKFGLLTVCSFLNVIKKRSWWRCICDCGKETIISRKKLLDFCSDKRPLSCGCIAKQNGKAGLEFDHSEACLAKYQDLIRFREVKKDCWIWNGYRQRGKTPKTSFRNISMSVRRCMYMISNGVVDLKESVHTKCGNLYCFNPDHLTLTPPKKRVFYDDCHD